MKVLGQDLTPRWYWLRILISGCALVYLSACATTSTPPSDKVKVPNPAETLATPTGTGELVFASPDPSPAPAPEVITPPPTPAPPPVSAPAPIIDIPVYQSPLPDLPFWTETNLVPALSAFRRSCKTWKTADPEALLNPFLPDYGYYKDWNGVCALAAILPNSQDTASQFFENQFIPVNPTVSIAAPAGELENTAKATGLMTGYYQPEIEVRRIPDLEFFEPILAVPKTKAIQNQARALITPHSSRVIAYGRPLDVFFMQIQGSGHIRFKNGRRIRAAYDGNNGHNYRSIGGVLIRRGALTKDKSSKRDIENWMIKAGPVKARALMNENPRYIYFKEQAIIDGEGPLGAMRVPLTAHGSMAVDPRYHPYGVPYFLTVKLPQKPGDYKGTKGGRLVIAQDTGKAIRGAFRGDLYFGSGKAAGALAGIMKHRAEWVILLPRDLAHRKAPIS